MISGNKKCLQRETRDGEQQVADKKRKPSGEIMSEKIMAQVVSHSHIDSGTPQTKFREQNAMTIRRLNALTDSVSD